MRGLEKFDENLPSINYHELKQVGYKMKISFPLGRNKYYKRKDGHI